MDGVAELLPGVGSLVVVATFTVALTEPIPVAVTIRVAVTDAPLANVPIVQVMVPPASAQVPAVAVAETNAVLAGTAMVAVTPAAEDGPALETTTV